MTEERRQTNDAKIALEFDQRDRSFIQSITWGMFPSEIDAKYGIGKLSQNYLKWKIANKLGETEVRAGLYKAIVYFLRDGLIEVPPDEIPNNPQVPFDESDMRTLAETVKWIREGFPVEKTPRDYQLKLVARKLNGKSNSYVAVGFAVRYMKETGQL